MTIDFTNLAIALIFVFGVFGWVRGARRSIYATAGAFVGMAIVGLIGQNAIVSLGRIGVHFHTTQESDLLLAGVFVFVVYAVQLTCVRLIAGADSRPANRRERLNGALLGLVNGFLVVANTMRYVDPFISSVLTGTTGRWTFQVPLPHFSHPDAGTFSLTIAPTTVTVVPSPLLRLYDSLPTALILLFGFLVFVFLGTLYGRVIRSRK